MKKKLNVFTAILFAAAFLLNLSFDSNGNFFAMSNASAKFLPQYKGPQPWYCFNDGGGGTVGATLIVCDDEGSESCSPTTPCPAGTHP